MNLLTGLLSITDPNRAISFFGETFNVSLNWIGRLIRSLVQWVGIVGVGIILFSVILKLVVLPFDIIQRVNMSKQNAKIKQNQEKLEKLQKQYANDKAMYSQKMMEMYKENGINMFASCLPAILSIIIFIVAINAFTSYSQYANLAAYNKMVKAYNAEITAHTATLDDDMKIEQADGTSYIVVYDKEAETSGKFIYYVVENTQNYVNEAVTTDEVKSFVQGAKKSYYVDTDALQVYDENAKAYADSVFNAEGNELTRESICTSYVKTLAQKAVKIAYDEDISGDIKFLWIKNIWETDASYTHPVAKYSDFKADMQKAKLNVDGKKVKFTKIGEHGTNSYDKDSYNEITAQLSGAKKTANGYYILIVLSIGTILLQQFVSQRTQKEQQKYSSVDGTGAMNQKTMMVMMTIMFGIFAFMYSAAFSIYMVVSNLLSLLMTLIINKVVEIKLEKEEERALQEKYNKRFPNRKGANTTAQTKKRK